MRIGLDIRYIYDHFPGIGRYAANLVATLVQQAPHHTFVLLTNPSLPNTRYNLANLRLAPNVEMVHTTERPFSLTEQVQLPRLVRSLRLDVLHSPYYIKPYAQPGCRSVVTIHDLIGRRFPATLPYRTRLLFNLTMWLAVRTADQIITVSHSSRSDITHYYHIPPQRIAVTPEAADHRFKPQPSAAVEAVRAKYRLPPRYVLYLGANKPHKNLVRLVRAWKRVCEAESRMSRHGDDRPVTLVLAGHYDPRYPEVQQEVQKQRMGRHVSFLHNVKESDLPALYSGAEVFAFLSYYEGFGLPPLEAMACGVPVVCAYASSLPEVVGEAALLVDPFDTEEIAWGLRQLLASPSLRAHMRAQSLQRARTFSWERTARATLAVYEQH